MLKIFFLIVPVLLVGCAPDLPSWHVGDCYEPEHPQQLVGVRPPWEAKEQRDRQLVHLIIGEWELIDGGRMTHYFWTAYSVDRHPWWTQQGSIWTETEQSLARGSRRIPCPSLELRELDGVDMTALKLAMNEGRQP